MSEEHDDPVADELGRLFADDRLELLPAAGFGDAIVAGARRRRRRRGMAYAAGGSTVVVVALAAGLTFGLQTGTEPNPVAAPQATSEASSPQPEPPAPSTIEGEATAVEPPATQEPSDPVTSEEPTTTRESTTEPTETSKAEPSPRVAGGQLGPDGFGQILLGQSYEDLKGRLAEGSKPPSGCSEYQLRAGTNSIQTLVISGSDGLVRLVASGARTPEGIGVGSERADVDESYPGHSGSSYTVPVDDGSSASYVIDFDEDEVSGLRLVSGANGC